jgi:hypothetical protein
VSTRKITDLERLTQPGGKVLPDDESIPVLTERLSLPSLELDVSLPEGAVVHSTVTPEDAAREDFPAPATVFPAAEADAAEALGARADARPVDATRGDPPPDAIPADATLEQAATALPASPAVDAAMGSSAVEPEVAIDWTELEQRARDALLGELQSRLASEIDRQLRERLQPTLVRMLLATVTELRPAIDAAVRESVSRVVAAEVARQRAGK